MILYPPDLVKRADSIQSRRKVSSLSDRSDTSDVNTGVTSGMNITPGTAAVADGSGGEESPGVLSDDHDHPPESPDSNDTDDTAKGLPWIKVKWK